MACSLECRAPFLDHELVAFARSLPLRWRLGAAGGKRILKDWARDLLPAELLNRPKMGFGVPVGAWFRTELQDLVRERLLATDSLLARVFRPPWLAELVNAHISGRANHEHRLWALLMLELWHQRWNPVCSLDGP
jgi:asparagine synthase (glutamine-hydrolysing)